MTPPSPERSMPELLQALFAGMSHQNFVAVEALLDEGIQFDFPGTAPLQGTRKVRSFLRVLWRQYPRLEFEVHEMIVEGERACAFWTNQGQTRAGDPYENRGMTLVHACAGRIILLSDYFKDTSFVD